MTTIWTEKYRPKTFADVIGQKDILQRVTAFVEQKNMPHLLFAGPAGVGKSTLALIIARSLFGENWKSNFLELNASDERGIDVVRIKVKDFARTKALGNDPFKIIFLDECDALTKEAQQALRRTMENYTRTCRFVLSCNYSSKIIEPIMSRCAVFRFKSLTRQDMHVLVERIAKEEGLVIEEKALAALFETSDGDCRQIVNIMQSCASLSTTITEQAVYAMAAQARPAEIKEIVSLALQNKFLAARDKLLDMMLSYGLSGIDVIKQIQKEVWNTELDGRTKIQLIEKCGDAEFRLVEGSDEYVQLEALLASITLLGTVALKSS
ncbi:replication factor C small subunit [Candidatus Woesearchaeota archaeon]|nr:replication factor C small subunit [Candidatus Woesearchaeota archaeon]